MCEGDACQCVDSQQKMRQKNLHRCRSVEKKTERLKLYVRRTKSQNSLTLTCCAKSLAKLSVQENNLEEFSTSLSDAKNNSDSGINSDSLRKNSQEEFSTPSGSMESIPDIKNDSKKNSMEMHLTNEQNNMLPGRKNAVVNSTGNEITSEKSNYADACPEFESSKNISNSSRQKNITENIDEITCLSGCNSLVNDTDPMCFQAYTQNNLLNVSSKVKMEDDKCNQQLVIPGVITPPPSPYNASPPGSPNSGTVIENPNVFVDQKQQNSKKEFGYSSTAGCDEDKLNSPAGIVGSACANIGGKDPKLTDIELSEMNLEENSSCEFKSKVIEGGLLPERICKLMR